MGQRHQAFVIARIRPANGDPPRHRCVAAYHHQWCYGSLPLLAAQRFMTLVRQKHNADIVEEEIRALEVYADKHKLSSVPCPFIAFLLGSSFTTDLEDPDNIYLDNLSSFCSSSLDANMSSGGGHNDDGITVIDVTDMLSPAYCFVDVGSIGLPTWRPLSAETYLRHYYPEQPENRGIDDNLVEIITSFKGERIIDLAALAGAWPHEYGERLKKLKTNDKASPVTTSHDEALVKSLADIAFGPAITTAIESGETEAIAEMIWLPGKCAQVREVLQNKSPLPDAAINLMEKVIAFELKSSSSVDLRGFHVSDEQLLQLLMSLNAPVTYNCLDISHNPNITVDSIRSILVAAPNLQCIILLGCSLDIAEFDELRAAEPKLFYNIESIVHPQFFRRFIDIRENAIDSYYKFSIIMTSDSRRTVRAAALPFFTPTSLVEGFTDWFSVFQSRQVYFGQSSSLAMCSALTALPRGNKPWGERSVAYIPQFSLGGLLGQGWVFGLDGDWGSTTRYGFLRVEIEIDETQPEENESVTKGDESGAGDDEPREKAPKVRMQVDVQDLRGFLDIIVKEGRPSVAEEKIKKLEAIIVSLKKSQLSLWQLFKPEEIWGFAVNAHKLTGTTY